MANEKFLLCLQIVDFESFSKVLNRPGGFRDPGEPEEYCRGFQVFDKDMTGFIGVGQLRYSQLPSFHTSLGAQTLYFIVHMFDYFAILARLCSAWMFIVYRILTRKCVTDGSFNKSRRENER